jgi:hypothetical protein
LPLARTLSAEHYFGSAEIRASRLLQWEDPVRYNAEQVFAQRSRKDAPTELRAGSSRKQIRERKRRATSATAWRAMAEPV